MVETIKIQEKVMENKNKFAVDDERHIKNPFLDEMPTTFDDILPSIQSHLDKLLSHPNLCHSLNSSGEPFKPSGDLYTGQGGFVVMYHRLYLSTGNKQYLESALK